jgi:hypothetical protein
MYNYKFVCLNCNPCPYQHSYVTYMLKGPTVIGFNCVVSPPFATSIIILDLHCMHVIK